MDNQPISARCVVRTVDGLGISGLAPYGDEWIAMPRWNALSAESVVFDWHYADNPDPALARRSWRDGRFRLPPTLEHVSDDLLHILRQADVKLFLVNDTQQVDPAFLQGWDSVTCVNGLDELLDALPEILAQVAAADRALLWIATDRLLPPWDFPDELFDRYFDVPPEELEEGQVIEPWPDPPIGPLDPNDLILWDRLQASRAAALSAFDAETGLVNDLLWEHGLGSDTLWVLTGSGGYPLGEHGQIGFGTPNLHNEAIHLPLIMKLPNAREAGRRVLGFSQSVDLMPTLFDAFNLAVPTSCHGQSLWPMVRGEVRDIRGWVCSGSAINGTTIHAVRTEDWGLMLPIEPEGEPQLYQKPDDRYEVNDLRQPHIDAADALTDWLRGFAEAASQPGALVTAELPDESNVEE